MGVSVDARLRELADLHESGILTGSEFVAAKRHVLSSDLAVGAGTPDRGKDQAMDDSAIRRLTAEAAVARIDRKWERDREKYLIRGRYGRLLPSAGVSTIGGLLMVSLLSLILYVASEQHGPAIISLIGVIGIFGAVIATVQGIARASS